MKHSMGVTLTLIIFFILSQVIGLFVIREYVVLPSGPDDEMSHSDLPLMDRPDLHSDYSFIFIIVGVLIGTGILLLLIKLGKNKLWKWWYSLAVIISLIVSIGAFIDWRFALAISLFVVYFKVIRPNVIVHNISELFVYAGIAAIFVPEMSIFSAFMLLVAISIYDAYAVWKSKHMIKLARFQTQSKMFAGLVVPYSLKSLNMPELKEKEGVRKKTKEKKPSAAILGGGDMAFPLIFTGVVFESLLINGVSSALFVSLIIPLVTAISLFLLFLFAKKGKFYPAMPFVSLGCFLGYLLIFLIF